VCVVQVSALTYPWDLADMGVEAGLNRLREIGFEAVELTTTYHSVATFTPGARGRRLMSLTEGAVFFPARPERYGSLAPRLWPEQEVQRVWPAASELAGELGLALRAWLVACYLPWLVRDHPEVGRVLATGERLPHLVCAAAPAVHEFLAITAEDIVSQFEVDMVQLETVSFVNFDYELRYGRVLSEVTPWTRRLLNLCFCDGCMGRAQADGVDAAALRMRVAGELHAAYESPGGELHEEWAAADPDFARYADLRDDGPAQLVTAVARAVRAASPQTAIGIWGPTDPDGTPLPIERLLHEVDALQVMNPYRMPERAGHARELADSRPGTRVKAVHWAGRGRPESGAPPGPELAAEFRASAALPADIVNVFNWAMLPPGEAASIVPLLREAEAAQAGR
jgi:hypothetical protein